MAMLIDTPPPQQDEPEEGFVSGEESDPEPKIKTLADKRRARSTLFGSWLRKAAERKLASQIKREENAAADEELSIRALLAQNESTPIITDPREYQIELFERARAQNTTAVLDTGSGKTLIAVLLLRHIIDQELEDRREGKRGRIAFFLVPSVTLVFQQFAVLERNLDHSVDRFCGAMKCDLWTREIWDQHFSTNKVIVCTADILHQCLMHSFLSMSQINLLIFDEAHHAKKDHAYAKIIRDFYLQGTDRYMRPRIFGMTASPVDAKVDVVRAASDLEDILCSRIATTADMAMLQKTIVRPHEEIVRYAASRPHLLETDLYRQLKSRFGGIRVFQPLFDRAIEMSRHLGHWCSDLYWTFALVDKKAHKIESKIERRLSSNNTTEIMGEINTEIENIKLAFAMVSSHTLSKPRPEPPYISMKLLSLHNYLAQYFERPSDHRCIVFVEQRIVAGLLQKVFQLTGGAHLRPGVLTGSGSGAIDDVQATFRCQVITLMKFRKGELNCLFATSVAEEGLDVPDCNLVIRFDMCKTMIQYVQSRGRARHKNSRFLHMLEINNSIQDRMLQDNRYSEMLMRKFCEALPEDRRLVGNDDISSILGNEDGMSFTVPSTGAKITSGSSLQLLGHFVSSLPNEGDEVMQPAYVTSYHAGKYLCEVKLPDRSPIRSIVGKLSTKKASAKRSAAFEACVQLYQGRYLSDNLVPIYTKKLPLMRNAALALNMKKTNEYSIRCKPSVWETGFGSFPKELYAMILDIPDGLDRPHQPLVLLTRSRLPIFPEFPLFLTKARPAYVRVVSVPEAIAVSAIALAKLTTFTLCVYKDVFNKEYEFNIGQMSYWLAPATKGVSEGQKDEINPKSIDWEVIDHVDANKHYEWTPEMPNEFLLEKFMVDKFDGGRRFFSQRLAPEYGPLDPVPVNTAKGKFNANILEYTISRRGKDRVSEAWDMKQPVVEAEKVRHRRNMLAAPHPKEIKEEGMPTKCFLCPEPLKISALPPRIVSTCLVFPAMIHRIESYLVALEAFSRLGLDVKADLALEAVTKDSDNSEDHHEHERINFRSGMGKNYERLEFLGDCFLKMATSISVFTQNPNDDEFDFHVKRMLLLCNKNLFNVAKTLQLYEYIRSQAFSRRSWYPMGLKFLRGKAPKHVTTHSLSDKTIADVCEAIMAAAFVTHNREGAWNAEDWTDAVVAVTKLVGSEDHAMMSWSDYSKAYEKPAYQMAEARGAHLDLASQVETVHDYRFRFPRLLQSAFNHPSYPIAWSDGIPSYQRLEFLGDSLLDMACISHIFYNYPDKDPQWLTEHKMAMVSNKFLGAVCVLIGFHKHIRHNSGIMTAQIDEYVEELENAAKVAGAARDFWTTVKDPPKCLPDVVEAYVGAIFIDSDFNYNEVQKFFDQHIKPYFEDMSIYDTYANNHPVTRLYSIFRDNFGCEEFQLMASEEATGDDSRADVIAGVMIHECPEPIGAWRAKSARYARIKAALLAAEELQGIPPFEFRARYGCDCHIRHSQSDEEDPTKTGQTGIGC